MKKGIGMALTDIAQRYYDFCINILGIKKRFPLIKINFYKSWWHIFLVQKWRWAFVIFVIGLTFSLSAIVPLFISYSFESGLFIYFIYLLFGLVTLEALKFFIHYSYAVSLGQALASIQFSAYRHFLLIDPVYHGMRSSGEIFAKIERSTQAIEQIMDLVITDLLPIFFRVTAVIISFFAIRIKIGLLATACLAIVTIFNIILVLFNGLVFEKKIIIIDDTVKNESVESISQFGLIRSSFATPDWVTKLQSSNHTALETLSTYGFSFWTIHFVSRFIYFCTVFVIAWYLFYLQQADSLSVAMAIGFLSTYYNGTRRIVRAGRTVQKLNQSMVRVNDLFEYIQSFGEQSFPVLPNDLSKTKDFKEVVKVDSITLDAQNLHFAYPQQARIFDGHNLYLSIDRTQKNKLYGIIGPSGIGKTTLASILGGQLKPDPGSVRINNIPIYHVDDYMRRNLIAYQGQVATSLSGNVKDNLLLGIPRGEPAMQEESLITLLIQVGLWSIFEQKEGLHTQIGQGGMSLSVGQRQRLNFASLYLRAYHYRPMLIIIDEPTSSLDQISEQSITLMIEQLAQHALTLVIAHRMQTLQQAVGILDCSLLPLQKEMVFYSKEELLTKSEYYRKLIKGEVPLEE